MEILLSRKANQYRVSEEKSMVIYGIRSVQCEIRSIITLHSEVWYRNDRSNHH